MSLSKTHYSLLSTGSTQKFIIQLLSVVGAWWLSGRVLDSGSKCCGFGSHRGHCVMSLGLSKTLYPLLCTGSFGLI